MAKDVMAFLAAAQPGDALLSTIDWELSNLFIEGFWSHQAIYCGNGRVIEAVASGVREISLSQFMLTKDHVAAYRPTFASIEHRKSAVAWCQARVGLPYDFYFDWSLTGNNAFYCAELYGGAYLAVIGPSCMFLARDVMGCRTFVPQDVANAVNKFSMVISTKNGLP